MYVHRRTFKIKPGKMKEAVALILEQNEKTPRLPSRVLTPEVAPFDMLVIESELETLEEYEIRAKAFFSAPTTPAFFDQWDKLTAGGGTNEIWRVAG
jgi:hypothetical protein